MANKCVVKCLLKDSMVEVVLMLIGRLLQATSPANLKAQSSNVVYGMFINPCKVDADLNAARF